MESIIGWLQSWTINGKLALLFFPIFAGLLLIASLRLVKYAEVIIAKTKFGSGFVGGTLIATVTSMPEMITEITQGIDGKPENGIGDDIGSNAFSIFLIAIGAVVFTKFTFMNKFGRWTKISLTISFALSLFLSLFLILNRYIGIIDIPGPIGLIPMSFFIFYLFSIWLSYKFGDKDEPSDEKFVQKVSLKKGVIFFTVWSLLLILFSIFLNVDVNAFQNGLEIPSESIGGVFLAITTSLPEIVAFFVFMKKEQPAAAIASLVGSHFFNLGISFFGDLAYHKSSTFNNLNLSRHYPLAILTAIMLFLLILHFILAKKFPNKFKDKKIYLILPVITIISYCLGWTLILLYN